MRDRLKAAFDEIHAETSLKAAAKAAVREKMHRAESRRTRRWVFAAVCLLAVLLGGGYLSYALPVAAISLDVNPSVELAVNVYDRVVGVTGYETEGAALAAQLSVQHMRYPDAVSAVLEDEAIQAYLTEGRVEVTVAAASEEAGEQMKERICRASGLSEGQVYCTANTEEIAAAHDLGLSVGKYRAFLELKKVDPDVTAEQIKGLSMRQIREWIETGSFEPRPGWGGGGGGYGYGRRD